MSSSSVSLKYSFDSFAQGNSRSFGHSYVEANFLTRLTPDAQVQKASVSHIWALLVTDVTTTSWGQEYTALYAFGGCYFVLLARGFLLYYHL